jgi:NADH-quinone oxidoreductase subunit E
MMSAALSQAADLDKDFIDAVLARNTGRPGALLAILQAVQAHNPRQYLPADTLAYIAARAKLPPSTVYSVASFYALFNLTPQGRNAISVCRGTACHTRGSRDLYDKLLMGLRLQPAGVGEAEQLSVTTADGETTLRTVACFGQCALAPVIEINHTIFGHMNEQTLHREMAHLDKETRR